jgi:hypothetical protein
MLIMGVAALLASQPSPKHIFAPTSFWYHPIPADAPLNSKSADYAAEFTRQIKAYYGHAAINLSSYASPVYVVGPNAETFKVTEWDGLHKGYTDPGLADQWQAVPIPAYAEAADGTDQEMTIYQPSSDRIWEFWLARKVDGKWQACWGGRMDHVSHSDGIWPGHYGTTATSLPFMGGQITPEELRSGKIDHVMGIALVDLDNSGVFSWPATRSDGSNPNHLPNRIPEGLRFRLDPHLDVDALNLNPVAKAIAKAGQKYGFVVWDRAGAITLRANNPKAYLLADKKNPYLSLFGGIPDWKILEGFPWDSLRFLPMNYGRPPGSG